MGFPGYFEIPGFSRYGITRLGEVINLQTGMVLKGSINPDGYCNFRLTRDDGHCLTIGRHRVLGLAFKHPGIPIDNLVINHMKGVKGQDDIEHLEWTTYQGNAEHAGAMGLSEKCLPISVRNVDTGEVIKYPSFIACSRATGLSKDAISYRISVGEARVFPERRQYRLSHDDGPWLIPDNLDWALAQNGLTKCVQIRYLTTGIVKSYPMITDLANELGISQATMTLWLNQPNQPVLPGFIQLKWQHDPTPWREPGDLYLELEKYTKQRAIKVIDAATGQFIVYSSAVECAAAMGLKPTTLNMRLKSEKTKVYSDGYSYVYYSESFSS